MTEVYSNWSENLTNDSPINYPTNDKQLIKLIKKSRHGSIPIRVIGNSHSVSPVVANLEENVILVSLSKYQYRPKNIHIDDDQMTVQVNAGWKLGQLYDELNERLYFLETQPASGAFAVGGVLGTPVHGGRLGGSLLADSVVGITYIDENGNQNEKTDDDEDFNLYRINFGGLGILTSVTFKIHQMLDVESKVVTHDNIFTQLGEYYLDENVLKDYFWDHISYCLAGPEASGRTYIIDQLDELNNLEESVDAGQVDQVLKKQARYTHCFIDYHNNKMLSLDWKEVRKVRKVRVDTKESITIPKVSNAFHRKFVPHYRERKTYLKMLGKLVRGTIHKSVSLNNADDQDMLWVGLGTRAYFMAYFVPVYTEGEKFNWDRVAQPLNLVMNTVKKFQAENRTFILDFPSDLRFVTSSDQSLGSPIYSEGPRTVYLAMEILCGPGNIYLSSDEDWGKTGCLRSGKFKEKLNADFREFYSIIEQGWTEMGGVPHWGKMFGFGSGEDPFQPEAVKNLLSSQAKEAYQDYVSDLFVNGFVQQMLSS